MSELTAHLSALQAHFSRRRVWPVVVLLSLAFAIRLVVAVDAFGSPQTGDALEYDYRAQLIASGDGFGAAPQFLHVASDPRMRLTGLVWPRGGPTAFRPPLYPLLLGGVYVLTGRSTSAGRVLQALIGTGVVALTGLIAFQLWGWAVGVLALALAAVFAPAVILGEILLTEPLFVLLTLAAVAVALEARRREPGWRWPLLAGSLCGLAILTRSAGLVLAPCIALMVWQRRRPFSRSDLVAPILVVLAAVVMVTPWTVRNALVLHRFIPVTDQGGYTLAGVYNSSAAHDRLTPWLWRSPPEDATNRQIMASPNATEPEVTGRLGTAARRYIGAHPGATLGVVLWNSIRMLALDPNREQLAIRYDYGVGPFAGRLAVAMLLIVGALAAAGLFVRAARAPPRSFWLVPIALWFATAAIQSGMRFRAPIDPFLIMLAAVALRAAWVRWLAPGAPGR
jgi:4-amino-4-deoxy-L-arabinose transferase-like glycosyltransferase